MCCHQVCKRQTGVALMNAPFLFVNLFVNLWPKLSAPHEKELRKAGGGQNCTEVGPCTFVSHFECFLGFKSFNEKMRATNNTPQVGTSGGKLMIPGVCYLGGIAYRVTFGGQASVGRRRFPEGPLAWSGTPRNPQSSVVAIGGEFRGHLRQMCAGGHKHRNVKIKP